MNRAEIELLLAAPRMEAVPTELRADIVAAWDFSAEYPRQRRVHPYCRFESEQFAWCRRQYAGARHARTQLVFALHELPAWPAGIRLRSIFMTNPSTMRAGNPAFTLKIPQRMGSGVYAARLRVKGNSTPDHEDYIPFFVRPPTGTTTASIALVMSTHSYMAYANDNLSVNSVIAQLLTGQVPLLQPEDLLLNQERGYGLGTTPVIATAGALISHRACDRY